MAAMLNPLLLALPLYGAGVQVELAGSADDADGADAVAGDVPLPPTAPIGYGATDAPAV